MDRINMTRMVNKTNQLLAARKSADTIQSAQFEQRELLEEFKIANAAYHSQIKK